MDYKSISEFAALRGVSPSRVMYWLKNNRLAGAKKAGSFWIIPAEADPGIKPVGRPSKAEEVPFRIREEAMLTLCAAPPNLNAWRRAGTPRFMAGMALMLASAPGFDRARYLVLAEQLDPSMLTVEAFEAWLKDNPYKPSRFLPMLQKLRDQHTGKNKKKLR